MNSEEFKRCIEESTSAPIAAEFFNKKFSENGFVELACGEEWPKLKPGKYCTKLYDNTVIGFCVGNVTDARSQLKMVATHIDVPGLVVKPNPDIRVDNISKLNVEVYGGPILNTWFDRPLSISGKVAVKGNGNRPEIRLLDIKEPVLVLPNLAIHMNKDVNKGVGISKQKEMLPILCAGRGVEDNKLLVEIIAENIEAKPEDILDYDLYVYNCEETRFVGANKELILSPRLDNMTSSYAAVEALIDSTTLEGISMVVLYDNEEVGSRTKQGAASSSLQFLLRKLARSCGINDFETFIMNGEMVSVDVAHATHPNYSDKSDITNRVTLNGGIVIKKACSQSYATDCRMGALVKMLCDKVNIPYQVFVNNSDMPGGSTLGSIASTILPMNTVDIGIPLLAMHSANETCGVKDLEYMKIFLTEFLEEN